MQAEVSLLQDQNYAISGNRLIEIVSNQVSGPDRHESAIPGLEMFRSDSATSCQPGMYEPSLCFGIQGTKSIRLGDREIILQPFSYLFATVHLPVLVKHLDATPERPYLGVKVVVQPEEVTELLLETGGRMPGHYDDHLCPEVSCGLCHTRMDDDMHRALGRLLSLLETPNDIPVLAPLAKREILYRALIGELGPRIRKVATIDSQAHRISQVITILQARYTEPLRIAELAEQANMSESTLFHTFKKVTRMSPLQFQKKLRLHEARRLMLVEGLEAASASYRVGYESPSQFSREYSRLFGAPPRADVSKLRGGIEPRPA